MTTGRTRRGAILATSAALATLAAAGTAQATTVSVTGDDGNPAALTPGVTGQIRNMAPQVGIAPTQPTKIAITGPDGASAILPTSTCWTIPINRAVDYRGNGAYTISVTEYAAADKYCQAAGKTTVYTFAINAGVALPPPTGRFLTRKVGSYTTNRLKVPIAANPGSSSIEVVYKRNAAPGPDGGLAGEVRTAYWDRSTGIAELSFPVPGAYTVVARASYGLAKSPWSAPITIQTVAPFDISRVSFLDSRGPSYQVKGYLYDSFARGGKVHISIAKGAKGGKFRSLGSAKITRKGTFVKRFTQSSPGKYRLRYTFKGSKLVVGGKSTQRITIRRTVTYR